jgi:hypothetical protein
VLRRLGEEDELIVIDSPPVLPVADVMALSAQPDAALSCVGWDRRRELRSSLG